MDKKRVAITGGIGSGKSTLLKHLGEMGYEIFSCDDIYKQIISKPSYIQAIEKLFPQAVNNGKIDKKILGEIVFNHEEKRKQLNDIAHPLVMHSLLKQMNDCEAKIVFAEVPLLFEGKFENLFDKVFYIQRDKEERIRAVLKRDKISIEEIEKRMHSQFDPNSTSGKLQLTNINAIILENDGSKEGIERMTNTIMKHLS